MVTPRQHKRQSMRGLPSNKAPDAPPSPLRALGHPSSCHPVQTSPCSGVIAYRQPSRHVSSKSSERRFYHARTRNRMQPLARPGRSCGDSRLSGKVKARGPGNPRRHRDIKQLPSQERERRATRTTKTNNKSGGTAHIGNVRRIYSQQSKFSAGAHVATKHTRGTAHVQTHRYRGR